MLTFLSILAITTLFVVSIIYVGLFNTFIKVQESKTENKKEPDRHLLIGAVVGSVYMISVVLSLVIWVVIKLGFALGAALGSVATFIFT